MIKRLRFLFLVFICGTFLFGCTYHGSLRNDFHTVDKSKTKLPLKACLIYDSNVVDKSNYIAPSDATRTVDISFQPAFQQAMINTLDSLFENLYVNSYIDKGKCKNADILIFPTIEIRGEYQSQFYMSMLVKAFDTDEVIQKYESSGDISWSKPASMLTLGIINILSGFLLSPIIIPSETNLLGETVQEALEKRISSCLDRIANDIRNDRSLVIKAKKVN
jgi:hypothetical protein